MTSPSAPPAKCIKQDKDDFDRLYVEAGHPAPPANPASGKAERVGEDASVSMSPERKLRAGIKLLHHHALWLDVVNYRNDPRDQELVDRILTGVTEQIDQYFAAPPSDKVLVSREALEVRIAELENENSHILAVLDVLPKVIEGMSIGNVKKEDLPYPKNYWIGSEDAYKKTISIINAHVLTLKSTLAALRSELEGGE